MKIKIPEYRVLLIEDNRLSLKLLVDAIHTMNAEHTKDYRLFISDTATNILDAAKVFDKDKHNLIITDRKMDYGDGENFIRYLQDKKINTPVIFATGAEPEEIKLLKIECKTVAVLKKPFKIEHLKDMIKVLMQWDWRDDHGLDA